MSLIQRAPLLRDQVLNLVREEIAERRAVGDMLPSEPALAAQLKVSRKTVRAAYTLLVREGLIERHHGKGTFVVSKTPRGERTGHIGLCFFSSGEMMFGMQFYTQIIASLFSHASERGWSIGLMHHDVSRREFRYDWREHEHRLNEFQAVVLLGVFKTGAVDALAARMPVAAVDAGGGFALADSVVCDNVRAGLLATEYLLEHGHRAVGFVGQTEPGDDTLVDPAHIDRFKGYRMAMRQSGLEVSESLLLDSQSSMQGAATAVRGAIDRGELPTAIFVTDDVGALAGMRTAKAMGLRLPQDLSVIGIGNEVIRGSAAGLTTVELHPETMGKQVVRLLERRIDEPSAPPEHCIVNAELVERTSVAPYVP